MGLRDGDKRSTRGAAPKSRAGSSQRRTASSSSRASVTLRAQNQAGKNAGDRRQMPRSSAKQSGVSVSTNKRQLGSVRLESSGSSRVSGAKRGGVKQSRGIIGKLLGTAGALFAGLFSFIIKNKFLRIAFALVLVIGGTCFVDNLINGKKIYEGVYVGDLDLSGMTVEEAEDVIFDRYAESLQATRVIIFANEEASKGDVEEMIAQQEAIAEQVSVEEARESTQLWVATADSLAATVPAYDLAMAAYDVGREDGGILKRFHAFFFDYAVEPYASYDEVAVEELATEIDLTLGDPRVDFDIAVSEGVASVVDGHDGYMMNRDELVSRFDEAFMGDTSSDISFVAKTEYAPLRITREQAQAASDYVNSVLTSSVTFTYVGQSWTASQTDAGSWIATEVVPVKKKYELNVYLDPAVVKPQLLTNMHQALTGYDIIVDFEEKNGEITVKTDGASEFPQVDDAVKLLDSCLFNAYREEINCSSSADNSGLKGVIEGSAGSGAISAGIENGVAPTSMSFEEALDLGIVTEISSFTTEYVNSASTQNRRHNIHLAADMISGSVVESNGGQWSFNERVGEASAEAGFLGAGAIVSGELDDAVGGGICQVATTVFNSVYEGGYQIVQRNNHTLYIASYPAGRDAAIAYPYMDLIWKNDTTSDVLMMCSYTDSSLTVSLYGVDPNYSVSSVEGEWEEGEKYKTEIVKDETLKPGTSKVETVGRDGKKITVYRTVKDASGSVIREDAFSSTYDPVTEVVIEGPPLENADQDNPDADEEGRQATDGESAG